MSTKTTFKRIALVAVAALGLGVLSVAPSSATVSGLVLATTDGSTKTTVGAYDTSTAAKVEVNYLAIGTVDTATIAIAFKSAPTGATTANIAKLYHGDTRTAIGSTGAAATISGTKNTSFVTAETSTGFTLTPSAANTYAGGSFWLVLDTTTAVAGTTLLAGTYSYTVVVSTYTASVASVTTKDVSIVVGKSDDLALVASAVHSTLGDPSATVAVATVSSTNAARATLAVTLKNAANLANAAESVTATITGPGTIGVAGGAVGKSVLLAYTPGSLTLSVYSDGTAGVATIAVSTPSVTFPSKTITFYAAAAKTMTASVLTPVLGLGANDSAVAVTAVDSLGINWSGAAYIVASAAADALVGGSATTPVACSYNATKLTHYCPVTTTTVGTAKFKVIDAATVALATATSNEVSVTSSIATAATVKVAFDKATYAPGEKAIITVTPLSSTGAGLAGGTANYLAAALTSNVALTVSNAAATSFGAASTTIEAYNGTDKTAGSYSLVVYMPQAVGTVTLTGKGGTALPIAGQVAVTASADVVNSSVDAATDAANEATDAANAATDAALAAADAADAATAAAQDASDAVAALSATVAKLVASLKAQITSLTNLVIKIQKKVKA